MAEHQTIKPEGVASTAAVALESQLILPAAFQRETFDAYKGKKNDTVNVTVPGILPWHEKDFRFDRATGGGLTYDLYNERSYPVKLGRWGYSAVGMTAEQIDFDFGSATALATSQGEAIGKGINAAAAEFAAADSLYDVVMGVSEESLDQGLVAIRQTLRKFKVPTASLTAFVGANWEAALALDDRLNLASNVGNSLADNAFNSASLGARRKFNFVVCDELADDDMIVMSEGAFVFANAAPTAPKQSAAFAANGSYEGVSVMWVRQWDTDDLEEKSVFTTWYGFRELRDPIITLKDDANGTPQRALSDNEYFVRAIKVKLNGTGAYGANSADLATVSGVPAASLTVAAPPAA